MNKATMKKLMKEANRVAGELLENYGYYTSDKPVVREGENCALVAWDGPTDWATNDTYWLHEEVADYAAEFGGGKKYNAEAYKPYFTEKAGFYYEPYDGYTLGVYPEGARGGRTTEEADLSKLPLVCAAAHPVDGKLIFIKLGAKGYWRGENAGVVDPDMTPEKWNEAHDVTPAQMEAMLTGSMFGWHTPGANPDNHNADGTLKDPVDWTDDDVVKSGNPDDGWKSGPNLSVAKITEHFTKSSDGVTCVAHKVLEDRDSTILWAVMEYTKKRGNLPAGSRCITCGPMKPCEDGWGYKEMLESEGLRYCSCPLAFLSMAPPDGRLSMYWRGEVHHYHRPKTAKSSIPKPTDTPKTEPLSESNAETRELNVIRKKLRKSAQEWAQRNRPELLERIGSEDLLSVDNLPEDTQVVLLEPCTPVAYSESSGLATAFDPDPRPYPMELVLQRFPDQFSVCDLNWLPQTYRDQEDDNSSNGGAASEQDLTDDSGSNSPKLCAYNHPEDGRLIFVEAGKQGYRGLYSLEIGDDWLTANEWNEALGVSKTKAAGMFASSIGQQETPPADRKRSD
jgi:hypothetical protein